MPTVTLTSAHSSPFQFGDCVWALCGALFAILTSDSIVPTAHAAEFVAPYVQTVAEDVELILDLAEVGPDDYLIDLGSGDGRFVIGAGRRGAMAHGVELNPALIDLARKNAVEAGVNEKVAFIQGDVFKANISSASVVTIYLFPDANIQLRPKLLSELRPGTRLVSNSFHMGDWEPDGKAHGRTSGGALLWIIPADVSGTWQMQAATHEFSFALQQSYQKVTAEQAESSKALAIASVRLRGSKIWFTGEINGNSYIFRGRVDDGSMKGIAHTQDHSPTQILAWEAHRVGAEDALIVN